LQVAEAAVQLAIQQRVLELLAVAVVALEAVLTAVQVVHLITE
jgi:hypothetical protein